MTDKTNSGQTREIQPSSKGKPPPTNLNPDGSQPSKLFLKRQQKHRENPKSYPLDLPTPPRLSSESCSSSEFALSSEEHALSSCSPTTTAEDDSPRYKDKENTQLATIREFKHDLEISDMVLARNSVCTVRQAVCANKDNHVYAVKLPTRASQNSVIIKESRILSNLFSHDSSSVNSSSIVGYHGTILQTPGLVLTYYSRTIKDHLQGGPVSLEGIYVGEQLWLKWALQLCDGLQFLQSKKIIHCDLKSDCIYLDRKFNAYIGDFTFAQDLNDQSVIEEEPEPIPEQDYDGDKSSSNSSSPTDGKFRDGQQRSLSSSSSSSFSVPFSAPELLSETDKAKPTYSSDVFSLGLVMLNTATGSEPYEQASKSVSQKLIWARRGTPMMYCSDEDIARMSSVQGLLELFITDREPLATVIIPELQSFASEHGHHVHKHT